MAHAPNKVRHMQNAEAKPTFPPAECCHWFDQKFAEVRENLGVLRTFKEIRKKNQ